MAIVVTNRSRRLKLQFTLATFLIAVAVAALAIHNIERRLAAGAAEREFERVKEAYDYDKIAANDLCRASSDCLNARWAVPFSGRVTAHAAHVERAAKMRETAELLFAFAHVKQPDDDWSERQNRQVRVFQAHYHAAVGELAAVAGYEYAKALDATFDFPSREVKDEEYWAEGWQGPLP